MFQRVAIILFILYVPKTVLSTDYSDLCFQANGTTFSQFTKDYTVLYDYLTGTGAHNFSESVTIGFLGAYGQAQVVLGALPLAVEAVNKNNR